MENNLNQDLSQDISEQRYMDVARRMNLLALGPAPGAVFWKPKGSALYENLRQFILKEHKQYDYSQVKSPQLVNMELFNNSGHAEKYSDYMFSFKEEGLALRPMSCPNHIVLYQSSLNSYRDLPVKYFEFGEVFRNEPSGSLQVLFRQRQFCQDDAHVFAKPDDIQSLLQDYLSMSEKVYKELGFEKVEYMISLRPEKRFGDDALWDKAEGELIRACQEKGLSFGLEPGGGAFYGPKIELKVRDKLNRLWQLGVIQLDYVLPERFDLHYIDENNQKVRPVILHHAVLGSMERMIGILLEVFGVDIPLFLHPVKAAIVSVSDKSKDYAIEVQKQLCQKNGWLKSECIVDDQNSPLPQKIAKLSQDLIPQIYVVGPKEAQVYKEQGIMKAMLREGVENRPVEL
jgi:threonyl-tRNA synthetase